MIHNRQMSMEPKRIADFFTKLQNQSGEDGFLAVVEVCGFNDWLLLALPKFGAVDVVLIQPKKRPKVKTIATMPMRSANSSGSIEIRP